MQQRVETAAGRSVRQGYSLDRCRRGDRTRGSGSLSDWLSDILEVVLSDFQRPAVINLRVGYDAARQMVVFSEPGDSNRRETAGVTLG